MDWCGPLFHCRDELGDKRRNLLLAFLRVPSAMIRYVVEGNLTAPERLMMLTRWKSLVASYSNGSVRHHNPRARPAIQITTPDSEDWH